MLDITTGQSTQVAQHDGPVKVVKWIDSPQAGILVTGSWDKTLKARVSTRPRMPDFIICPLVLGPSFIHARSKRTAS